MKSPFSILLLPLMVAVFCSVSMSATASESIIRKASCFICHSVEAKRVGPAYKDVAARYRGDDSVPDKLFNKVRQGGAGNWGEIPMNPHPVDTIGDDDLKAAIQWILSRK